MDFSDTSDKNIKRLITSLKIAKEQRAFLLDDMPNLSTSDRLEFLEKMREIYYLNLAEEQAIAKLDWGWQKM